MRDALGRPLSVVLAVSALAALGLTACGGSGTSSTATQANAASTGTANGSGAGATGGTTGPRGATGARPRFTAVRECLQKQGVQLPTRPNGARGGFLGGANLPKGVTRAQLQSAISKCLGGRGFPAGGPGGARFSRARSPRFRQALSLFAACMRKNGVNVPQPNTSGSGPVFSTKGLNTASPQFKAATAKCRPALTGALGVRHARPGVGG
ncbi:MAG TPA: hypothetical protein VFR48_03750 [Solirubrobacteraceae bacterium]|nr:hypothetical protein [Solirubrobacteraceae bacterium]